MSGEAPRRYACDDPVIYARSVQVLRAALRRRARRLEAEKAEAEADTSPTEGAA